MDRRTATLEKEGLDNVAGHVFIKEHGMDWLTACNFYLAGHAPMPSAHGSFILANSIYRSVDRINPSLQACSFSFSTFPEMAIVSIKTQLFPVLSKPYSFSV